MTYPKLIIAFKTLGADAEVSHLSVSTLEGEWELCPYTQTVKSKTSDNNFQNGLVYNQSANIEHYIARPVLFDTPEDELHYMRSMAQLNVSYKIKYAAYLLEKANQIKSELFTFPSNKVISKMTRDQLIHIAPFK